MPDRPLPAPALARSALATLRSRPWVVVLAVVLAAAVLVVVATRPERFDARRTLVFDPTDVTEAIFNDPRGAQAPPTAAELSGDVVFAQLSRAVGEPVAELRSELSIEQAGGQERQADLIARTGSSQRSTELVDAWANTYIRVRQAAFTAKLARGRTIVRNKARELRASSSAAERRAVARARVAVLAARASPSEVSVVARPPVAVVKPSGALGLAAALLALLAVLWLAVVLDRRVRTPEVAAWAAETPVLGEVVDGWVSPRLRSELALLRSDDARRAIVALVGAGPGVELGQQAALDLAVADLEAGTTSRVVLVGGPAPEVKATARLERGARPAVERLEELTPEAVDAQLGTTVDAPGATYIGMDDGDRAADRLLDAAGAVWLVVVDLERTSRQAVGRMAHVGAVDGRRPDGLVVVRRPGRRSPTGDVNRATTLAPGASPEPA